MTNLEKTDDISLTRRQLLINIGQLGAYLPPYPIDELIHQLGGFKNVAEITSRKGRILKNCDNQVIDICLKLMRCLLGFVNYCDLA